MNALTLDRKFVDRQKNPKLKANWISICIWAHYPDAIVWHMSSKRESNQTMTWKRLDVLNECNFRMEVTSASKTDLRFCFDLSGVIGRPFLGLASHFAVFPAHFQHILRQLNGNSCNISCLEVSQLQEKMTYTNDGSIGENLDKIALNMSILQEMTLFDLWPLFRPKIFFEFFETSMNR